MIKSPFSFEMLISHPSRNWGRRWIYESGGLGRIWSWSHQSVNWFSNRPGWNHLGGEWVWMRKDVWGLSIFVIRCWVTHHPKIQCPKASVYYFSRSCGSGIWAGCGCITELHVESTESLCLLHFPGGWAGLEDPGSPHSRVWCFGFLLVASLSPWDCSSFRSLAQASY